MSRKFAWLLAVAVTALPVPAATAATDPVAAATEAARSELGAPGIELAVWKDGKIVSTVASGVRAEGSPTPVDPHDAFAIGSITKSLTSAMAGRLVEQGKIRWDSTIGEILGKAIPDIRAEYQSVTLEDLLSHQGGVVARLAPGALPAILSHPAAIDQHRAAAAAALSMPPAAPPRSAMIYSNPGYIVAAAMLEQATGRSWEDLVRAEIFEPMHLSSAGVGLPANGVKGHATSADGALQPLEPTSPAADNPVFLAPAGRTYMTMADLARFGGDQLKGLSGSAGLLQPATYQHIHNEHLGHAQLGWGGGPDGGFDNSGSNGRWLAYIRAFPRQNIVVAVAINAVRHPGADEDRLAKLVEQVAEGFRK